MATHIRREILNGAPRLADFMIQLYQVALSPFLGRCCRFEPTCSNYARDAISTRGLGVGMKMAALRLLRCHPLNPGGYDPPTKSCDTNKKTGPNEL